MGKREERVRDSEGEGRAAGVADGRMIEEDK